MLARNTVSLSLASAIAALALLAGPALAQYPERAIKLIVPFPPGGAVDVVTRVVADRMASDLGRPFVIENKAGAGGIIATDATAKADPDGYTLLVTTPNHTINAALHPKLPYDSEKDLVPIAIMAEVPEILVSFAGAPFSDFRGFLDYAKTHPGKLNYSSAGKGTLPHITMEVLLKRAGVQVTHVPYRGAAPAMTDLLAGQVQLKLDTYATSNQHVAAGKLKALAYASRTRAKLMPDLPTVAELGFPGYEGVLWIGLMAPAKTPQAIIDRLAEAAARAVRDPTIVARFERDGVDPVGGKPADFAVQIARETAQWREVAQAAKITLD